ncbi:hypothetical protein KL936_001160 [Ogataea polymorpha]|uniref:Ketopantoate reductase C-terminal domain-containing protein n=2 Tax=Ogataea polymorpha TaxID=460523 RepID=A0A9P8T9G2_9ASCO|nr:hypothetical protein KL936_001160 [Ogataea polymorpha]KAG7938162.1 hypothetical protein KL934_000736 [Ogataea polymorpha]KAH3670011.1 hypothetical protein OGATHE_002824 [Ogataea polymorpha]
MTRNVFLLGSDLNFKFLAAQAKRTLSPQEFDVQLLFNNSRLFRRFTEAGSTIKYTNKMTPGNPVANELRFKAYEKLPETPGFSIDDLIVSMNTLRLEEQILPYASWISKDTNLLFINPPLGAIQAALDHLWPRSSETRPNVFQAVSTHILSSSSNFDVNHIKAGKLLISAYPSKRSFASFASSQSTFFPADTVVPSVVKGLLDNRILQATYCPLKDVYQVQIETAVADCCLNALGQILNFDLGSLGYTESVERIVSDIVDECIQVLQTTSHYRVLHRYDPSMTRLLKKERLMVLIKELVEQHGFNHQQSVPGYATSYIVNSAKQHRQSTPVNSMLNNLLIAKRELEHQENELPFVK